MSEILHWITDGSGHPFYTRKKIYIDKAVKAARAKVCGLGQFVFSVNGQKVGDHELDPGWTNYRRVVEYVTFDLTAILKKGENVLGAEVGNGWFIMQDAGGYSFHFPPFMPPNPNPYHPFADALIFSLELNITYEDGSCRQIITDTGWKTAAHEVQASNIYGSEIVDASMVQKNFSGLSFDDSAWTFAREISPEQLKDADVIEQFQPPVKVIKTYRAKQLADSRNRRIYDFGQNMSFLLSFEVKGQKGDEIRIYPAEKLGPDGDVDQMAKGWMPINTVLTYRIGETGTWEKYRQKFTYFAGKVLAVEMPGDTVELSGDTVEMSGDTVEQSDDTVEIRNITADAITSAYVEAGTFTSDDPKYEQIYHIVEKAVEANMVSVHTDCPTIERFAWQEPNHLMGAAIMYMKNGEELWKKFLLDMRTSQHTADDRFRNYDGTAFCPGDGLIPSQAPCYIPNALPVPGMGSFYDIIPWGSSIILGLRWHYLFYGDIGTVAENYDAGMRYLKHLKSKMTEEGFVNHGLGDWGNPEQTLARENIETAFLYADAKMLAWFAALLGKEADASDLEKFAGAVKTNYNERLLVKDGTGRYVYANAEVKDHVEITQACEALPLYWGMVPEEHRADVEDAFRETLLTRNAFVAGEVGLPYIIQTARNLGMNEQIADFITREEHPSYYAFVKDGLTTLGEYWEPNPRSHCHDMMGHIIEWYYNGIGGIQPLEPGFKKVRIQPYLPKTMHHAEITYRSKYGPITVELTRDPEGIDLKVTAPDEIKIIQDKKYL